MYTNLNEKDEKYIRHDRNPLYTIWRSMLRRTGQDGKGEAYPTYKENNILVCDRWLDFNNFVDDVYPRPGKTYTVDRIDNKRGYDLENCRWATWEEQGNNRCSNVYIETNGIKMSVSEWARELDIPAVSMQARVAKLFDPPEPRNQEILLVDEAKIFPNVREAEKYSGVTQAAIRKCLCGHNKTAGGFRWEYVLS